MKSFIQRLSSGERGFTLIELLVVIAILGVLAAIAIPNVGKFLDKGHKEAAETELHNVQTAVMAAMADSNSGNVTGPESPPFAFGDVDQNQETAGVDETDIGVGAFIVGGVDNVQGNYEIQPDGTVVQIEYPGYTP